MKYRTLAYISFCIIGLIGLITVSCSRQPDARLLRAESMMTDSLTQARAILDSIDRTSLSEADRNLHDLLTIKAKDKAEMDMPYEEMQGIIEYYSRQKDAARHAEALYYGGRILTKQGDYPSALNLFKKALVVIPKDKKNLYLRGLILSQSARRLNQMRIYGEADSLLRESIEIDYALKDTMGLIYDLELMGAICLHTKQLNKATGLFNKTLALAKNRSVNLEMRQRMYLSAILYEKGYINDALNSIRNIPDQISGTYKATALGYAADIYLANKILDTAYLYAAQLERMHGVSNRKSAYRILLSPEIRKIIPADSIKTYTSRYTAVMEDFVDNNGKTSAIIQNSNYNYQYHENERKKAENTILEKEKIITSGCILLIACLIIIVVLLNKDRIARAYNRKSKVSPTPFAVAAHTPQNTYIEDTAEIMSQENQKGIYKNPDEVKKELVDELLKNETKELSAISANLLNSEIYQAIVDFIKQDKNIADESPMWKELDSKLNEIYAGFNYKLSILLGRGVESHLVRLCQLIKCGFSSVQIAHLMSTSSSSINYRRKKLAKAVFNDEKKASLLDLIISRL